MLDELRAVVCQGNLDLVREGLVLQTWGNVSGIDRTRNLVVIKPSGIAYDAMGPEHMAVVEAATGKVVWGKVKPSSDTPTHLALYRAFPEIGGVVHTHSLYATAWAQTCRELPALGTTHADYFDGPVPCTRPLRIDQIETDYELNTGLVIAEAFKSRNPTGCPGVLVASHGPFAWGKTVPEAVHHAVILEHVARLAAETMRIFPLTKPMPEALLQKHFSRKHGPRAYYGQGSAKAQDLNADEYK